MRKKCGVRNRRYQCSLKIRRYPPFLTEFGTFISAVGNCQFLSFAGDIFTTKTIKISKVSCLLRRLQINHYFVYSPDVLLILYTVQKGYTGRFAGENPIFTGCSPALVHIAKRVHRIDPELSHINFNFLGTFPNSFFT